MTSPGKKKIVIGITGASGSIYGKMLLEKLDSLRDQLEDCGVIFSENAETVWKFELGSFSPEEIPFTIYKPDNLFAPVASGSSGYDAMIVCPCTMGTLGRIAAGVANDLLTRAADVMLKERKKLILVAREMPYNLVHLNNMKLLSEAGAIICPASPSFYSRPSSSGEMIMTVVNKVLLLAGFEFPTFRWGE
jgi:4-hydroxy-3-polyprenylbenzoate decarboxylase